MLSAFNNNNFKNVTKKLTTKGRYTKIIVGDFNLSLPKGTE